MIELALMAVAIFAVIGFNLEVVIPALIGAAPAVSAGLAIASAVDQPDEPDLPAAPETKAIDSDEIARNAAIDRRRRASLQSLRIEPGRAGGGSGLRI